MTREVRHTRGVVMRARGDVPGSLPGLDAGRSATDGATNSVVAPDDCGRNLRPARMGATAVEDCAVDPRDNLSVLRLFGHMVDPTNRRACAPVSLEAIARPIGLLSTHMGSTGRRRRPSVAWLLASFCALAVVACAPRSSRPSGPDGSQQAGGATTSQSAVRASTDGPRTELSDGRGVSAAPIGTLLPRAETADPAVVSQGIAAFRKQLPAPRLQPSLEPAVNALLSRAAESLNRNDSAQAIEAATEAVRIAPERLEPLEVLLLSQLSAGRPDEVRTTLNTVSTVEPSSPIALAFAGLDAAQRGDAAAALASFAWFVGEGAVPRRGAAIPLPTAPGEIEEQAALAALRLGAAQAALEALDAAMAIRSGDEAGTRALQFLRAEALAMLGRGDEALATLDALAERAQAPSNTASNTASNIASNTPSSTVPESERVASASDADAVALLAIARADELRVARGLSEDAARLALARLAAAPLDDFALRRVVRLGAALAGSSDDERLSPAVEAAARIRAADETRLLRAAVARAACVPAGTKLASADKALVDSLAELLAKDPADRAAARGALRILARRGIAPTVEAAAAAVAAHPNELDALTTALAATGFEVDALVAVLRTLHSDSVAGAEALRSRLLARFALVEEAFAVADTARARDRASAPALAAAALAAAELGDDTLLAEIDDDALGAGDAIARTLSAAWLALGDAPRARDRAQRAVARDSGDVRAEMLLALSTLTAPASGREAAPGSDPEQPAEQAVVPAQSVRDDALRSLRRIARGTSAAAADARVRLAELGRSNSGPQARDPEYPADSVETLTRAIALGEVARLRLGAACLALADDIDPSTVSALGAAAAGSPAWQALVAVPNARGWAARIVTDAPALAARRQLLVRLLATRRVGSADVQDDPSPAADDPAEALLRAMGARSVPTVAGRFDWLAEADEATRARTALAQAALRPRTPSSLAAIARAAAASGDYRAATAALESSVAIATGPISERSARALLSAAADLAQRDPSSAPRLEAFVDEVLARLARTGPEDMSLAMRVLVLAGAGEESISRATTMLARAVRPIAPSELPAYAALLQSVVAIERDPYPASRLARALVREDRLLPAVRARLAASAIALDAAAGSDPEATAALVAGLVAEGVPVLARGDEAAPGLAIALVRASSIASMVGDESMSEELLRSALAASPDEPEALNNLAYRSIERGAITREAADFAERAAAARPDDPSILDTLGLLRYHQGRLRDDASGVGAISLFRQALRLQPESPSLSTLDHLGDALWRAGDQAGALRAWKQIPDLALLRYPPANIARSLADFQRREFGLELVEPERFLRRQYGEVVQRADRKLQEVARGSAPSVAPVAAPR